MKYTILVALSLGLFSFGSAHATQECTALRPSENYFVLEYVLKEYNAPNWDDECFESFSGAGTRACYQEAEQWGVWLSCLAEHGVQFDR